MSNYIDKLKKIWNSRESFSKAIEHFRWTKRSVAILVIVIAVIAALAAGLITYTNRGDREFITTKEGITYQNKKELTFSMSSVRTLNPFRSNDQDTYFLSRLIYDGLFSLDAHMTPQNNLASAYQIRKSSHMIHVQLVNTKFHNGKTLTAQDVKYTVEAFKAAGNSQYKEQIDDINYVEADGTHAVNIYFHTGGRMTLADLTFPILPSNQCNGIYDVIHRTNFKPIGTGRYRCRSYNSSTGMSLAPYAEYHGTPAENHITVNVLSKGANRYKMTEASNLSLNFTKSITREGKVTQKDTKLIDFPANEVEYLGYNFYHETMASRNLRRGIACAIDNQSIIQECYYNCGMTNGSIYYPDYLGVKTRKDPYRHSSSRAEQYLGKAGYRDRDNDGYVEDKEMKELTLTLLTSNTSLRMKMAKKVKEDLEEEGIHVSLSYTAEKNLEHALKAGNFDLFIAGCRYSENINLSQILKGTEQVVKYVYESDSDTDRTGSSPSGTSGTTDQTQNSGEDDGIYHSSSESGTDASGNSSGSSQSSSSSGQLKEKKSYSNTVTGKNYTRYYSKQVNRLLDAMDSGLDRDAMKQKFQSLHRKLSEDLPYYCLLYKTYGIERAPALRGTVRPTFWDIYRGCENWHSRFEIRKETAK